MLTFSFLLHAGVVFFFFGWSAFAPQKNWIESGETAGLNVMWAETISSPAQTPEWKLPGPIVPPPQAQPETAKEDVLEKVLPIEETKAKPSVEKSTSKPLDRTKALEDALASLGKEEKKPTPRLDNYTSVEGATKAGMPSAPYGGGNGALMGNPKFIQYKRTIQKTITQNFVWLKENSDIKAEVTFQIATDGSIANPKLTQTSGNVTYDESAMRAIRKSSPLPLPPQELLEDLTKEVFVIVFQPKK